MATPAVRFVRRTLPGCFIGGLVRPGLDDLLAGTGDVDELHVARSSGVMGPKFVAAKVRPRRYDTAMLFTNSFSTALITRIAGIPRRIGYDRDARGLLLTDRLRAPTRSDGRFAPVPAIEYYLRLACEALLKIPTPGWRDGDHPLRLEATAEQEQAADLLLDRSGLGRGAPLAVLNPGGNNPAKRWPADRFSALAGHLARAHGLCVAINGSPDEADLAATIRSMVSDEFRGRVVSLADHGVTLASLKGILRRSRLVVTNDTGPRHMAAAVGVRLITLFGPTDHRWTSIPTRRGSPEVILLADPALPPEQVADDHPERCRIDRISLEEVIDAADRQLAGWQGPVVAETNGFSGEASHPVAEPGRSP